jgi:hypothetical protein
MLDEELVIYNIHEILLTCNKRGMDKKYVQKFGRETRREETTLSVDGWATRNCISKRRNMMD